MEAKFNWKLSLRKPFIPVRCRITEDGWHSDKNFGNWHRGEFAVARRNGLTVLLEWRQ